MKLILDGSIQARIDSHNRVLLAQVLQQSFIYAMSHFKFKVLDLHVA